MGKNRRKLRRKNEDAALTVTKKKKAAAKITTKLAEEILERHSHGETLLEISKDDGMPTRVEIKTFFRRKSWRPLFTRAHEEYLDTLQEEIPAIADDGSNDWAIRYSKKGNEYPMLNHEHFQRSRLRIDARRMILAAERPQFSGKVDITNSDGSLAKLFDKAMDAAHGVKSVDE